MLHLILAAVICSSVERCVAASHAALRSGNLERAEAAALTGLRLGECSDDGPASDAPLVMARIALRRGEPLMARAWLGAQPDDRALQRQVEAAIARLPPATGPAGRYSQEQGAGLWDEVVITQPDNARVHFKLDGVRLNRGRCEHPELFTGGDLTSVVPALALLEGEAARQDDAFVFESREFLVNDEGPACRLTFRFSPGALTLEQDRPGEACGFGFNVNVGGDYVRTK